MRHLLLLAVLAAAGCGVSTDERMNCNSVTCDGCCDDTGMCRPGNESFWCGANAEACTNCSAGSGGTCDASRRQCLRVAGEPCRANGDCRSNRCDPWPVGGACGTASCTSSSCQSGEVCFHSVPNTAGSFSTCMKACSSSRDCRPEYMCIRAENTDNRDFCYPDCRKISTWCTGGRRCNTSTGVCE